uniref:Uncharacterized protein n=1 Tax=Micrurus surinamensis TaxID=129470 RepID=A0A2D4P4E6_MICSU
MKVTVVYKCVSLALDFFIKSLPVSARKDVPSGGPVTESENSKIGRVQSNHPHCTKKPSIKQSMSVGYPRSRVPCSFKDILKKKEWKYTDDKLENVAAGFFGSIRSRLFEIYERVTALFRNQYSVPK